jgi:polyisoprenoid-binding protein YceI
MKTGINLIVCLLFLTGTVAASQPRWVDVIKNESSMTYHLVHPLHKIEATSKEVVYRVCIDPVKKEITSVAAQVDVTTFDSGNSNRDSHAMEVIDAISYPDVVFSSTSITSHGDSLSVTGRLTFHGVTNDVVIPLAARWLSSKLQIQGVFALSLTAFKIERPSLLLIPVEDALTFEFASAFAWE